MDTYDSVITQEFSCLLTLNPIPALLNGSSHIRERVYSIFDREGRNDELTTGASNYFLSQAKEVDMGVLKPGFYIHLYTKKQIGKSLMIEIMVFPLVMYSYQNLSPISYENPSNYSAQRDGHLFIHKGFWWHMCPGQRCTNILQRN